MKQAKKLKSITPWPPPPNEENNLPEELGKNWSVYQDYVPWIPGKLYQTVCTINASKYLPQKHVREGRLDALVNK